MKTFTALIGVGSIEATGRQGFYSVQSRLKPNGVDRGDDRPRKIPRPTAGTG